MPVLQSAKDTVQQFSPISSTDIVESDNDFYVHVDLPGIHPNDLDISINNGFLDIKAERRQIHEDDIWLVRQHRTLFR